ncbi:MAG: tail fiber domain-containing protein [Candidatus Saccharimonadales bacterium]
MLVLSISLLSVLSPLIVQAADSHFVAGGAWVDRHQVKIAALKLTDTEYLDMGNDRIKELGPDDASRLAEVNKRIAEELGDGLFTSPDISPDSNERGRFYRDSTCGGPKNQVNTDDIDDSGNPTSNNVYINWNNLYISDNFGNCLKIISAANALQERNLVITLSDETNRTIWFKQVTGEPTLNRVDGKADGFKKFDKSPNRYIQRNGDCVVRVEFAEEPKTAGLHDAFYETCDEGNSLIGGATPSIVGSVRALFTDEAGMNQPGSSPVEDSKPSCESQNSNIAISWLVCGMVGLIDQSVQSFGGAVDNLLNIQKNEYDQPEIKIIWSVVKNFATFLLIAVALIMVISQALDFGPFDAYTIRKVLPKLIIAVILMQLSWFIFTSMIQIFNEIAWGLEGIMYAPFGGRDVFSLSALLGNTTGGTGLFAALAGAGVVIGAGVGLALGGVLALGAAALLGLIIGFMTLVLRKIILIMLLVLAPLALVAWILPNTDKYWKLWWESFSKLLLMYPLIVLIIAAGRIFAYTAGQLQNVPTTTDGLVSHITDENNGLVIFVFVVVGFFAPYFLIPKTFQLAGSAFGNLTGMINNRKKGAFDRLRNSGQNTRKKNAQNIMDNKRWKGNNALSKFGNKSLMGAAMIPKEGGWNAAKWGSRVGAARSARITALSAKAGEHEAVLGVDGNDDLLSAGLNGSGSEADAKAYLQGLGQRGRELNQNVAAVMAAKNAMGKESFEDFAAARLAGTGTGYASGPAEMLETINRVAGGDSSRAARILVKARGEAEKAKRPDLYGAGMATSADQLAQLARGQTTAAAVNEVMTDEALNSKSAAELGNARNNSFTTMSGAIQRRLARAETQVQAARATGDADLIATAEHVQKQAYAATSAFLDYAGGSSPENAQLVGAMMGQETGAMIDDVEYVTRQAKDLNGAAAIDSTTNMPVMETVKVVKGQKKETVGARIEQLEGDAEFKQYKKTYSSEEKEAAAKAAQNAAQNGPPGIVSDKRLKKNISHVQTLDNGIRLYSFEYIWGGPVYVGVIAQEILRSHPEAVVTDKYGYYAVDYETLGLKLLNPGEIAVK